MRLADHRAVIREACVGPVGVEVDTQGDAFFFAFPTAPGALAPPLPSADSRRRTDPGAGGRPHGDALLGEEGYVGLDVHRAARIAAAGTAGRCSSRRRRRRWSRVELRDLGEHRLQGSACPSASSSSGSGEFPALKSLYRTNLPVPATTFLGRERELDELGALSRPRSPPADPHRARRRRQDTPRAAGGRRGRGCFP